MVTIPSSLLHGESSHKFIGDDANPIMKFYYERVRKIPLTVGNISVYFLTL